MAGLLATPIVHAQTGPKVWVAPSLQRVGPSDGPGSATQAQVWAARGEYESFQIVVRAPAGGLNNVNVSVSDLQGPGGQIISKKSFMLYRERYVYVSQSSPDWGGQNRPRGAGWYPDGLIPFTDPTTGLPLSGAPLVAVPFSLSDGQNQPIWADILVPRTAAAGNYTGTYTVTSSQGSFTGQIVLTVWNFTLPLQPTLKSSFLFWQAGNLLSQQELLRHKLSPKATNPADQSALISQYGLSSTSLPFWSGADNASCTMAAAPSATQFQTASATQQSGLYLYDYSADEIGSCTNLNDTVKQWARTMHQAGIRNLITMAPTPYLYDDGSGTGRSAVDIWTMLPIMYDGAKAAVAYVQQKGDATWSYNTLVQDSYSPKWLIDFDPVNFRIQPGFISQCLNLKGLLYWRIDRWSSDPWNNVNNTGQFSSANYPGEGMLVYPGQTVGIQGVAPSMRLKWLRDGIEDYEYVTILQNLGQGTWAMQMANSVGADWANWTRDPLTLESVRRQLGDAINNLAGATPPPPNPPPANGATAEAENATRSGAIIANNNPGYTGAGYADYQNLSGDYIEWTVNASPAGNYSLDFRYANGSSGNRPLALRVNGVVTQASVSFLPTGSWATWKGVTVPTSLQTGANKIRLTAIGLSGPNIDSLTVK